MPRPSPTGHPIPYPNANHSGVRTYELTPGGIILAFHGEPRRYLYTNESTGPEHIARMTALARAGRGLSTYVSQHVQHRYARKLPAEPSTSCKAIHD